MDALRLARRRVANACAPIAGAVWAARAEIAVAAALLGGWACVTAVVASLVGARAWVASLGLLLLAMTGIRYIGILAWKGLYALSHEADDDA